MQKLKTSVFKPILAVLFLTFFVSKFSFAAVDGEAIFKNNCSSCHKINEDMTGPALKDIEKRRDRAWIYKWVHNSSAVVASGDKYAVDIFCEQFNQEIKYIADDGCPSFFIEIKKS